MEAFSVQQILDSAARAASSEDYASAESLLREAARLQESSLGSQHPDLASTFNNLAVVCEKANNLAAAGEFYERAFSIASASLDSEHPLVLTSRDNLKEFHRVHGRLDEALTGRLKPAPTSPALKPAPTSLGEPAAPPPPSVVEPSSSRRLAVVVGAIAGVVLLGALAMLNGKSSAPKPVQETLPGQLAQENVPVAVPPSSDTRTRTVVPTSTDEPPRIVEASLCESLSTTGAQWQCEAPSEDAEADSLYFYTRIATATSTRVHHRWYLNGRLRQDVDLAIEANPSAGYRTYSRQRLDSGEWRVEAVTAEGVVLHEARVAIR